MAEKKGPDKKPAKASAKPKPEKKAQKGKK